MQICLVGQPELQAMVNSVDLLAVREQVCVSCHLGPLEREETGPYVEHRLRKVGWKGGPTFNSGAMDEIYRWTEGIPRRINMLCSRAIISRPAGDKTLIDAASVAKVAREQRDEIGETGSEPPLLPHGPVHHALRAATPQRRPVLFVAANPVDRAKAAALMAAMAERVGPPRIKLVCIHDGEALGLSDVLFEGLDSETGLIAVACAAAAHPAAWADLPEKFRQVVARTSPKAVVVFGSGEHTQACAEVARSLGIPIVHVGTGVMDDASRTPGTRGPGATGDPIDIWYPNDQQASRALEEKGVPAASIHCAGNLLCDAVRIATSALRDPMAAGALHRMVVPFHNDDGGYVIVLIEDPRHVADRRAVAGLMAFLRRLSHSMPLVLLLRADAEREFNKHRLHPDIFGERICYLPVLEYANQVELMRHATCVLTDSRDCLAETIALQTPCLAIGIRAKTATAELATAPSGAHAPAWAIWTYGEDDLPDRSEGPAGPRVAEHLCAWLRHLRPRPSIV